jgi:hypothetical protein
MSIRTGGVGYQIQEQLHTSISISPPQETTHLLPSTSAPPGRNWINVSFIVMGIYTMIIIWRSFSKETTQTELVARPPEAPRWTPYVILPENIYELPMNQSCQEKYLDRSSNNLCTTIQDLCQDTYNCPREAMVKFNPHATLEGFLAWQGNATMEEVSSETVKLCQREIFKNIVDYDISLQKNPIPGEILPCGERVYLISAEGCVVDGNHGVTACKILKMPIKVIRLDSSFFPLIEKVKSYIDGCWNRVLSAALCHLQVTTKIEGA